MKTTGCLHPRALRLSSPRRIPIRFTVEHRSGSDIHQQRRSQRLVRRVHLARCVSCGRRRARHHDPQQPVRQYQQRHSRWWGAFLALAGASDVTVDHNTVWHDGYGVMGAQWPAERFSFTNNLLLDGSGLFGPSRGRRSSVHRRTRSPALSSSAGFISAASRAAIQL